MVPLRPTSVSSLENAECEGPGFDGGRRYGDTRSYAMDATLETAVLRWQAVGGPATLDAILLEANIPR